MIAAELPDLVGALHRTLGEVVGIQINWSATEGQLDLESIAAGAGGVGGAAGARVVKIGAVARRPRLMVVSGRDRSVKLLVVPSMTSQALGLMMLRTAAGMPTEDGSADSRVCQTAQTVWQLAEVEGAQWCGDVATQRANGKSGP